MIVENKVLVTIRVPMIDSSFDVFIPVARKTKYIIKLVSKAVSDLTHNTFPLSNGNVLYNQKTGEKYDLEKLIIESEIKNGTVLILI